MMDVEQTIVKELIVKQLKWRVTPKTVIRLGTRKKKKKKGMEREKKTNIPRQRKNTVSADANY